MDSFGLKVAPIWVLWGPSICYLGTWTLWALGLTNIDGSSKGPAALRSLQMLAAAMTPDHDALTWNLTLRVQKTQIYVSTYTHIRTSIYTNININK